MKEGYIRIPKLGWVRLREELRFAGKIMSATISEEAGHWYVSITVEIQEQKKDETQGNKVIGIDLGINRFATIASEEAIEYVEGAKPHKALSTRLRRSNKSLSKKKKGSKNRYRSKKKLGKLHARIGNIRRDAIEKLTTKISETADVVGIEDLNIKGMARNSRISKSLLDMGLGRFRERLETKMKERGKKVVVADRWYASSKECSECGKKHDSLKLSDRMWECPNCGTKHDRDANAARNLRNKAVSSTVTVYGVATSGGTESQSSGLRAMLC